MYTEKRKKKSRGCGGTKERERLLIPLIVIPSQRKIFIDLIDLICRRDSARHRPCGAALAESLQLLTWGKMTSSDSLVFLSI